MALPVAQAENKRVIFTKDLENLLLDKVRVFGTKWALINQFFPQFNITQLKNK